MGLPDTDKRVRKGIRLLDEKCHGWRDLVGRPVNACGFRDGILPKLFGGDYFAGMKGLGLDLGGGEYRDCHYGFGPLHVGEQEWQINGWWELLMEAK